MQRNFFTSIFNDIYAAHYFGRLMRAIHAEEADSARVFFKEFKKNLTSESYSQIIKAAIDTNNADVYAAVAPGNPNFKIRVSFPGDKPGTTVTEEKTQLYYAIEQGKKKVAKRIAKLPGIDPMHAGGRTVTDKRFRGYMSFDSYPNCYKMAAEAKMFGVLEALTYNETAARTRNVPGKNAL